MQALQTTPVVRRGAAPQPTRNEAPPTPPSPPPRLLTPEAFRDRVEAEVARHDRYLLGFGVLRIGPRVRRGHSGGLLEAMASETRRTDSSCALPDGSCALLALNSGQRQLRIIVRRLMDVAAEIERERGDDPSDLVAALHAVRDQRVAAADMWLSVSRAFEQGRATSDVVVLVP